MKTNGHASGKSLLVCPKCDAEMRLFGIEDDTAESELYTFECAGCATIEVRSTRRF